MPFSLPVLYHSATHLIGSGLPPAQRHIYQDIRQDIERLRLENERSKQVILLICKKFITADIELGGSWYQESGDVIGGSLATLKCVVKLIRHLLIDTTVAAIYVRLICLIDALIRRGGFTAHWLIGRKRFLQTISLTGRRWKLPRAIETDPYASEASDIAMDCILAWHEGFRPVRALFPFYAITYFKLKKKYHIQFMRAENDPSRPAIIFERADPASLDDHDILFNESVDTTDHAYSDAHVSYSVYNDLYDNSSFIGAPKGHSDDQSNGLTFDDGTITTVEVRETESLPPFQYSNPKSEGYRKSVSIDDKPQYFDEDHPQSRPKSFQFQSSNGGTSFQVKEVLPEEDPEEDVEEEEEREGEEEVKEAVIPTLNKRDRMIDEDRAFVLADSQSDSQSYHDISDISPIAKTRELQPESPYSPMGLNDSTYSIDGTRSGSVAERIQLFSSTDSGNSQRRLSQKTMSDKEKSVEIKFFGTQRVVVPKRESVSSF